MRENKSFSTISIRFNKEEQEIIYKLKDKHGVNICGMIKILLKNKLEEEYSRHAGELPFHGWHHILFVTSKSIEFAAEIGANDFLVHSAALAHDLNYLTKKNSHVSDGFALRTKILSDCSYTPEEIEKMIDVSLTLIFMWAHVSGPDWQNIITREKLRGLLMKM